MLKKQKGFSLIELAVVALIVGVITTGALSVYSEQQTHSYWQQSDKKLDLVKKSLIKFAKTNHYLPCPAQTLNGEDGRVADTGTIPVVPATPAIPAVPPTGTAPTIPAIPAIPAQGTQNNVPVETCPVNIGFVPFRALGLSEKHALDAWDNPIRYAINQGTDDADRMLTCPDDSVCFFSNRRAPAFNLTTPPTAGDPGTDNLRVCGAGISNCSATTASDDVIADNVLVVLVAYNENGNTAPVAGTAEGENDDTDRFYVQGQYSEAPYFDDLVKVISANDFRERDESEVVIIDASGGNPPITANPSQTGPLQIAGGAGDDDRFSENIGINIESQNINFGSQFANQQVTLTLKAKVTGGWEDAGVNGGTPDTNSAGALETQDRFLIGINGPDVSDLDDTLSNLNDSVARFDSHETTESFFYDEDLAVETINYVSNGNNLVGGVWYETISINTVLDANGELNVDYAVFSTEQGEQVEISDVEATVYGAPGGIPDMPLTSASSDFDSSGTIDSDEEFNLGGSN